MRRFSFLAAMALCLFSVASVGDAQKFLSCKTVGDEAFSGSTNAATFLIPFKAGAFLRTDTASVSGFFKNGGDEVVDLAVNIASGAACGVTTGEANIKIGLYDGSSLLLLTTTDNIHLTAAETSVVGGFPATGQVLASFTPVVIPKNKNTPFFVGVTSDNPNLCLSGNGGSSDPSIPFNYAPGDTLPGNLDSDSIPNADFPVQITICPPADVIQDPVFRGFNGQHFVVKGEAGSVFNLISSPTVSFNNRFISLESEDESMTASSMKEVRASFKHSKLLDLVKSESVSRPPVTAAWNHPGTYMGESGITLGESKLYVAPGAYATGFASITLDGAALPVSDKVVELDGDITVSHPSAFKVTITTPSIRFSIVNADNFVNIEHAMVLSADEQLSGLLGQTANPEWEVVQSAEFKQHIENDYKLASSKLF